MAVTVTLLGVAIAAFSIAMWAKRAATSKPVDVWSAGTESESDDDPAQSRAKKSVAWATIASISCGGCGGCGCGG
ncbi:hypothetical protein [Mycolicibacterium sp. 120270]|uniref:hypothetical protein n=1 Tax=Mycolicibacterium sp. 120270 TaxID=3090600 RepID=UPI00299F2454|nr:hypothetical protein [Mycolicibacterium sp. 120270]MDX1882515.1 hypothetical protein [Mycolicibacterium sp. 120270]